MVFGLTEWINRNDDHRPLTIFKGEIRSFDYNWRPSKVDLYRNISSIYSFSFIICFPSRPHPTLLSVVHRWRHSIPRNQRNRVKPGIVSRECKHKLKLYTCDIHPYLGHFMSTQPKVEMLISDKTSILLSFYTLWKRNSRFLSISASS